MSNDSIRFYADDDDFIEFEARTDHFRALGGQLTSDIQAYVPDAVELLACIDTAMTGGSGNTSFEGNSSIFSCHAGGVSVESLGPVPEREDYTFEEARSVIRQYIDFLAPGQEEKDRHIATWEKENHRAFPRPEWLR